MMREFVIIPLLVEFAIFLSLIAPSTLEDMSIESSIDFSSAILIRVDQTGPGDFKKIQDAINSVPSYSPQVYYIWVKPGIYREKIVVPADKPFITLSGTHASNTIITWSETGEIFDSPTLSVLASDFVGRFLTIQNSFGDHAKAVALRVSGDRAAFYDCRILSYQDTLLDDAGRHYYKNCYVEGSVDFIFGNAASVYEECDLHSLAEVHGSIAAQHRNTEFEDTGFTFMSCNITGVGTTLLGRAWGAYSRVVFAQTYMSSVILPEGWNDWRDPTKQATAFFGEYECYGPGADRSRRVIWSRSLSSDAVAPFLSTAMIGGRGWLRNSPAHFIKRPSVTWHVAENN